MSLARSIVSVLLLSFPLLSTCATYGQSIGRDSMIHHDSISVPRSPADTSVKKGDTLSTFRDTSSVAGSDSTLSRSDTVSVHRDTLNIITSEVGANTVPGFRVQLASTQNLLEALSTKSLADTLLPNYDVYIIYDAPYYKVRVGDFRNRYDADRAVSYLASHGFPDAWSVPDNVFRNPVPRKQ